MCPICKKIPSPSCRWPSQQHWSWCPDAERLREEERHQTVATLKELRRVRATMQPPDLKPRFAGVEA